MDLFELQAVLRLNADQYNRGITEAETTGTGFIERIGNAWTSAKGKFQTVAAILGPVIDMVEQAVDAYADYQQSSDGVRRMFGDMADRIIDNAKSAYRTAGLSMNAYLDTVLDFGQRMLDGLGGDTEAAANLANAAIIQMADNVAAFGTDYQTVAGVYSSLSRGIYTTLDNLRLGYGGTREELERLMRDAERFGNLEAGSLDINNFADIVRAIGIIQQHNGIAGTAAEEGGSTITGSLQALKASWENLLTILGDPDANENDREIMAQAFADSLGAFLRNLIPALTRIIRSLIEVATDLIPEIVELLIDVLTQVFADPSKFLGLINLLVQAIVTALAGLIDILITGLISLFDHGFVERGGSAFTQWGVYDWINSAFGFGNGRQVTQYGGALPREDTEAPALPNGAPAPNNQNNPWYAPTTGESITGDERDEIMAALMEMYGFGGGANWRDFFGANELDLSNSDDLLSQLGFSPEDWEDLDADDMNTLLQMMEYVNTLANAGDMAAAAGQMNRLFAAVRILNEGGTLSNEEGENGILGSLLSDEQYAAIISNIRGIDEAIDEATRARIVEIGFSLPGGTEEDGSHASGLWSVPYDDYMARLHRDEMILTASQARDYREGRGGSSEAVVAAIEGLRNDMQHLQMVVGETVFGQTVVNYSGRRMSGYLGEAEDKAVSGYGWG